MRITIEYKPGFGRNSKHISGDFEDSTYEESGKITYENIKSVVDGPDLFPEFIEIRTINDENGGRKRIYIARETVKRLEIHEK